MDAKLLSYVDNEIIREHAFKSRDGYSLDIQDIDKPTQENFIDWLFQHDPIAQELMLNRAQELIDERIRLVESRDRYNEGYRPSLDKMTGEVNWFPGRF